MTVLRPGSRRAFSIIELVVVVAVVLILVAIVVFRSGRVTNEARNALIQSFLKDSRAIYHKLSYGSPPDFTAITSSVLFQDYVGGSTLGSVQLQLNGAGKVAVGGIPSNLFKDHRTSLQIDYGARTYDGEPENVFLEKVLW